MFPVINSAVPFVSRVMLSLIALSFVLSIFHDYDTYGAIVAVEQVESPYDDGLECASFLHEKGQVQIICFDSVPKTFLGLRWNAVAPAYYIKDGIQRPL